MHILQYFAKKQVGSLPDPKATLSNAWVHTKFRFRQLALNRSNYVRGLNCRERYHMRELMSFHFIFVTNFSATKTRYTVWVFTAHPESIIQKGLLQRPLLLTSILQYIMYGLLIGLMISLQYQLHLQRSYLMPKHHSILCILYSKFVTKRIFSF